MVTGKKENMRERVHVKEEENKLTLYLTATDKRANDVTIESQASPAPCGQRFRGVEVETHTIQK